jgi:hypothetical protein
MKGFVLSVVFVVCSLVGRTGVAHAETEWCAEDPVLIVDGRVVDITTSFDRAYLPSIRAPMLFDIQIPVNVVSAVAVGVSIDVPFDVRIAKTLPAWDGIGSMPIVARVTVYANASFDTFTRITGVTGVSDLVPGRSNSPTKVSVGTIAP